MEMSGQAHCLVAISPEPIEYEASWAQEPVWTFSALLVLPEFEPRPTHSLVTNLTELSRLSISLTCLFDVFLFISTVLVSLSFHLYFISALLLLPISLQFFCVT